MIVKATREGLPGAKTSSGYLIDAVVSFVALPNTKALHRFIRIANPLNGKTTYAQVLDVGPWNIDDPYIFTGARPLSESNVKTDGKQRITGQTNGAGIDLGGRVWNDLAMQDNGNVDWQFI
jgi:hypothetical protein